MVDDRTPNFNRCRGGVSRGSVAVTFELTWCTALLTMERLMIGSLNECIVPMYPTIQALNVDALSAGEHKFWFAVATDAIGHPQTLAVRVFKGKKPGKRIMITAGVHGDEQNGILTAQQLARALVDLDLIGTVTIVSDGEFDGYCSP